MRLLSRHFALLLAFGAALPVGASAADAPLGLEDPRHGYDTRPLHDRFTRFRADWEAGRVTLGLRNDLDFLRTLLTALEVPASSQLLVFTATSLQKGRIRPSNPRALYFNDDTYVGFVPGGQVEIISVDPELGAIFYIFDPLHAGQRPVVERAGDCLNCHSPYYLDNIPALVVESVIPGVSGGGERAFRREQSGHGVALGDRFGGWHVTGTGPAFPHHWGNLLIERRAGTAVEVPNPPGTRFDFARYPVATSDALAHLLHEHQVGFINRATLAAYRWRTFSFAGPVTPAQLDALAAPLVRYLLFADEVPLPGPGALAPTAFAADFVRSARRDPAGRSLRDLDGETRLLRHRCSYMIHSASFTGLPAPLRRHVLARLDAALAPFGPAEFAYLPPAERSAIREILRATLPDWAGTGEPAVSPSAASGSDGQ